jgi:hypothetical protein
VTSDDNHDDDAQLQQLRAVWVSMRDEDPPDRGLASLMAAARTKAAELEQAASPSWWQRIAATLRRPPVLALATVTLLLGGALIVTQRSSQMKVDATAVDERSTAETSDTQLKGDYAAPAAGSSAVIAAEPPAQPPAAPFTEGAGARATEVPADPPKIRETKPVSKSRPKSAAPMPTTGAATAQPAPDPVDPGATFEAGPRGVGGGATSPTLSIAQDDASGAEPEAAKQTPKKPIARTPAPSIEGEDRVVTKDAAKPTIDQLVKQCETAAARGDCAAVRVIAQKIMTTAPSAYKNKVANNAAIIRCMPDSKPNAVAE